MKYHILQNICLNMWNWYLFSKGIAWNPDFTGLSSKYNVYFWDSLFYLGKQESISNRRDWTSAIRDESVPGRLRIE